jgi:hypothetical protein
MPQERGAICHKMPVGAFRTASGSLQTRAPLDPRWVVHRFPDMTADSARNPYPGILSVVAVVPWQPDCASMPQSTCRRQEDFMLQCGSVCGGLVSHQNTCGSNSLRRFSKKV